MKFTEKNDFTVRHQGAKHFHKDLETFKKHFPHHALNTQLAKANQFSFARLDSQMLFILLDKVDPSEILAARQEKQNPIANGRIDQIKSMIIAAGLNIDDFQNDEIIDMANGSDEDVHDLLDTISQNLANPGKTGAENIKGEKVTSEDAEGSKPEEIIPEVKSKESKNPAPAKSPAPKADDKKKGSKPKNSRK